MGKLVHSADRRAYKLESTVCGMIERVLTASVTPLSVSIDTLAARIAVCEQGQGAIDEVTDLMAAIVKLRKDVDQMKSTYMSMIFGTVDIPDMPADMEVPLATIGEEVRAEGVVAAESEVETDKEQLSVDEEATYEGLTGVEEAMVQSAVQTSLRDTTLAGPS